MSAENHPVPDLLLERLARNDLPPAEADAIRERLRQEPGGQARLDAIAASDREILAALPPRVVAAEVRHRVDRGARAPRRSGVALFGVGLAMAGALAVFVGNKTTQLASGTAEDPWETPEITREKGLRPQIGVYRKRGDKAERLAAGAPVRAGDVLQLSYVAAGHRYGVIVSVDGNGTVTPHLPVTPGPAARLDARGETLLPESYELDASPGFERFVLIAADEPFDSGGIADSLRPGAKLPPGMSLVELTLRKELP